MKTPEDIALDALDGELKEYGSYVISDMSFVAQSAVHSA